MQRLAIGADNLIQLAGLRAEPTHEIINDASVAFTLRNEALNVVSGLQNVAMPYQTGSNGYYVGILPNGTILVEEVEYFLDITATKGTTLGFWRVPVTAKYQNQ